MLGPVDVELVTAQAETLDPVEEAVKIKAHGHFGALGEHNVVVVAGQVLDGARVLDERLQVGPGQDDGVARVVGLLQLDGHAMAAQGLEDDEPAVADLAGALFPVLVVEGQAAGGEVHALDVLFEDGHHSEAGVGVSGGRSEDGGLSLVTELIRLVVRLREEDGRHWGHGLAESEHPRCILLDLLGRE
ncbi:hypothetical protein PG993_009093 [Apiospora rasikravindrae]|uniref:Uncharacterized protein n=1 Tax=Apiospora rasikravindrae TaxID=990691 RepID=A0ABR1SKT4_9PEZI